MILVRRIIIVGISILILGMSFAQKRTTVNWFGYFKPAYQLILSEDGDNSNQFRLILATLGFVADINEYSSVFFFAYFNSNNISDIDNELILYGQDSLSLQTDKEYEFVASLLDAQIWFTPVKNLRFVAGQYVNPFAYENMKSSSKIDFINRGYVVRNSPAYRDIGIYADYQINPVRLYAGVSNGSGMNVVDNNNYKNILGRLEITPIDEINFGGAISVGKDNSIDDLAENQNFYSAFANCNIGGLQISTEASIQDYLDETSSALYAYALYEIPIQKKLLYNIIPAVRYDFHNPAGDNNKMERYTFGLTFQFDQHKWLSHLRLNYELTQGESSNPDDMFTVEFQMRFD